VELYINLGGFYSIGRKKNAGDRVRNRMEKQIIWIWFWGCRCGSSGYGVRVGWVWEMVFGAFVLGFGAVFGYRCCFNCNCMNGFKRFAIGVV
jgi:hypothetical protein